MNRPPDALDAPVSYAGSNANTERNSGRSSAISGEAISATQVRRMLREWARWVTWPEPIGPEPAGCHSAESAYRSPQCWDERLPRPLEPDWRLGWRIEGIVRALPPSEAKAVRVWYVVLGRQTSALHGSVDPFELAARKSHTGSAANFAHLLSSAEETIRERLE